MLVHTSILRWVSNFKTSKTMKNINFLCLCTLQFWDEFQTWNQTFNLKNFRSTRPIIHHVYKDYLQTEFFFLEILLNQTKIRLYLPYSDWFRIKRTVSVWFQINLKMVNSVWFNNVSKRFFCVYVPMRFLLELIDIFSVAYRNISYASVKYR